MQAVRGGLGAIQTVTEDQLTYKSEAELMKVLEIDTWRNLSKDKILQFATLMPEMDKELAIKVIEQFPEFRQFALDALTVLEKQHTSTLEFNSASQTAVHHAFAEVREILANELKRDDLSAGDRMIIIDKVMETANREFAKDSENKRFLDTLFGKAALVTGGAIAMGIVVLGGRVLQEEGENKPQQADRQR